MPSKRSRRHATRQRIRTVAELVACKLSGLSGLDFRPEFMSGVVIRKEITVDEARKLYPSKDKSHAIE
jgi:hypothetical protein